MANVVNFQKVPVDVQKRNGFDRSHRVSGTATCGTLHPVLTKFIIPSTEINLSATLAVDFPPFATDFKGRVNAAVECFFVPCRQAFAGWKNFIKQGNKNIVFLPWVCDTSTPMGWHSFFVDYFSKPNLLSYLGANVRAVASRDSDTQPICCALPLISYHLIYNYWYRNKNIQMDAFSDAEVNYMDDYDQKLVDITKSYRYLDASGIDGVFTHPVLGSFYDFFRTFEDAYSPDQAFLKDGHNWFEFRQRNYPKDYFTAAFSSPIGSNNPVYVSTEGDKFTIQTLRAGNALTQFIERFALAGDDYDDIIYANYGVRPSDAAVNHPIYLGRIRQTVYNRYVENNAGTGAETQNPLSGTLGAAVARGNVSDNGRLCKNFTATEHGYLMCLFSVWPDAQYNYGVDRNLLLSDITSVPWPLLQGVGMDAIYNIELYGRVGDTDDVLYNPYTTFGYSERYSWYKFDNDRVLGLMTPGQNLDSFALQRVFGNTPQLGSQFLQVGKNDMDNIFAVSQSQSGFSCWFDIYFSFRISAPIAAYCIPTLGEPKDARQVWIDNGGHML